jgi:hypothetical protein
MISKMISFAQLVIYLKLALAGLRLGLKNRQLSLPLRLFGLSKFTTIWFLIKRNTKTVLSKSQYNSSVA